jgi:predicted RNA binding protein YcfA (HicA-like mRNA interferase family)
MTRLPSLDGRQVLRALQRHGFVLDRIVGSHHILWHPEMRTSITIPMHGHRDLKPGTLRAIIRSARLSVEEFVALL